MQLNDEVYFLENKFNLVVYNSQLKTFKILGSKTKQLPFVFNTQMHKKSK